MCEREGKERGWAGPGTGILGDAFTRGDPRVGVDPRLRLRVPEPRPGPSRVGVIRPDGISALSDCTGVVRPLRRTRSGGAGRAGGEGRR